MAVSAFVASAPADPSAPAKATPSKAPSSHRKPLRDVPTWQAYIAEVHAGVDRPRLVRILAPPHDLARPLGHVRSEKSCPRSAPSSFGHTCWRLGERWTDGDLPRQKSCKADSSIRAGCDRGGRR